jgi:hypothetical protein
VHGLFINMIYKEHLYRRRNNKIINCIICCNMDVTFSCYFWSNLFNMDVNYSFIYLVKLYFLSKLY